MKYEEFILDPEKHLCALCDRLAISFERGMMNYSSSEESRETASAGAMWGNLVKPVLKNNTGKYRSELSEEQIRIFESVAGDVLKKLGYGLASNDTSMIFSEETIRSFDELNGSGKEEARKNSSDADIEKRKEQDAFLQSLKTRWAEWRKENVS